MCGLCSFSFFALFTALFVEHILKWRPCILCVYERIPWALLGGVAILCSVRRLRPLTLRWGLLGVSLICAAGGGLSLYHIGVEQEFWSFQACSGTVQDIGSVTELKRRLEQPFRPSCADVPWRLFGLSLSGYNAIVSLGLCLMSLGVYSRCSTYEKEPVCSRPEERL